MAENKKSFIAYVDWKDTFDSLPDDKAGVLIKHIFSYVNDENPTTEDILINAVFANIKNTLKRDLDKWDNQHQQRVKAGKKSAEVRKRNATTVNERSISSTVNDTVNVTVNDNVINNNNTTAKAIDFVKLLDYINTTFGRQFRIINDSIKTKYKARIKEGYTNEDIKTAIDNCRKSKHHIDTNFKYCTPEFFTRSVMLDKYSSTTEGLTTIQPQKFETLQDVKNLWQ